MTAGIGRRWLKFQAVGTAGTVVQLSALVLFHAGFGWGVLPSTAAAIELAILHNFAWHEHWTWPGGPRASVFSRLWRYNAATSAVAVLVNLTATMLLVQTFHLHYVLANLLAIGAAAIANFALGEFVIFRGHIL